MGNRLITLCPTDLVDDEDELFEQMYEVDQANAIGTGKFSTVHLCWRKGSRDERYALKVINTRAGDVASMNRIREEINILQMLGNHPSIITLIDVDESLPNCIRLVMELCEGGELYDRIQQRRNYSEQEAKLCVRNLIEGVSYVHSKGIMHRDLKPENVLLASKSNDHEVKISDFGLAKMSRDYPRRLPRSNSICGSDFYLAPEVIKQEEYGREIDIWACGVIAYVLLSGSLPFFHNVLHKLYRQIVERDISFPEQAWKSVSKGALDFILRLLQVRAGDRLTADQCLGHPWLREAALSNLEGSFTDIKNLARSASHAASYYASKPEAPGSETDLRKVLSRHSGAAAEGPHPLEHAHKVSRDGKGASTPQRPNTYTGAPGGGTSPFGGLGGYYGRPRSGQVQQGPPGGYR